jgi:hypothetical protein
MKKNGLIIRREMNDRSLIFIDELFQEKKKKKRGGNLSLGALLAVA